MANVPANDDYSHNYHFYRQFLGLSGINLFCKSKCSVIYYIFVSANDVIDMQKPGAQIPTYRLCQATPIYGWRFDYYVHASFIRNYDYFVMFLQYITTFFISFTRFMILFEKHLCHSSSVYGGTEVTSGRPYLWYSALGSSLLFRDYNIYEVNKLNK